VGGTLQGGHWSLAVLVKAPVHETHCVWRIPPLLWYGGPISETLAEEQSNAVLGVLGVKRLGTKWLLALLGLVMSLCAGTAQPW
jgi:hypothetical protein